MSDRKREQDFYQQQYNELNRRFGRLQEEQTRAQREARRTRMLAGLIHEAYHIVNSDVSMEEICHQFLQVILGALSVDCATLLMDLAEQKDFIAQYSLEFPNDMPPKFTVTELPKGKEYYFVNSDGNRHRLVDSLRQIAGAPYLLWAFNPRGGVVLVIGNATEAAHLHHSFEESDRELVEDALNVFIDAIERKQVEEDLRKHRNQLLVSVFEELVKEHTTELTKTNEHLRQEIAERKRLEESLQQRNRELALLNQVGQMFNSTIELNQVLATVMSEMCRLLHIVAASFWLFIPETGELVCQQAAGPGSEDTIGWRLALGQGIVGQAAQTGEIIHVRDSRTDRQHYKGVDKKTGVEFRSILSIPFRSKGKVIGVLNLLDIEANRFTEGDLRLAETIAAAAASAIENAHLYMTAQQQSEKLQAQQEELRQTNEELELTSKYKSEFLSNMSHELRTPLNSLLILSRLLYENKEGNLTDKQIEYSGTIHSSGTELLALINEVLDLSKVEAGKMVLNFEEMSLKGLAVYIEQHFLHVAEEKGLYLKIELAEGLPASVHTDRQRVEQIVKNLLSNAMKFTASGGISFEIARPALRVDLSQSGLAPQNAVAISVSDTGIGISEDKQHLIFEAFQQADGSTSKKYGGTGLGLSITKELAKLLGGEIQLRSKEGEGSTFSLYLPEILTETQRIEQTARPQPEKIRATKDTLSVEEPPVFAERPSGKGVEAIWDDRHEEPSPTDKFLLIIEGDPKFVKILFDLAREKGFRGLIAGDGEAGLQLAYQYTPSAIILDIELPGIDGWTVMEKLKKNPETRHIPVYFISAQDARLEAMNMGAVGYLAKPLNLEQLHAAFSTIDDTLFLHRVEADLPEGHHGKLRLVREDMMLDGKTILLVDDDMRHVFALSSVLEEKGMHVEIAENGKEALELLDQHPNIDLVLMDIMMPEMDGYKAMRHIRQQPKFSKLPLIALTAKAMKGDRQRCLDAGANDYLSKPLDIDKLLSLLRVWLY